MFKFLLLTFEFVSVIYLTSSKGFAHEPLSLASQALGRVFRYEPQLLANSQVSGWQLKFSKATANHWGYDRYFFIDAQTESDSLRVNYTHTSLFRLSMSWTRSALSPSYTDYLAVKFHEFWRMPQGGRLRVGSDETRIELPFAGVDLGKADTSLSEALELSLLSKPWKLTERSSLALGGGVFEELLADAQMPRQQLGASIHVNFQYSSANSSILQSIRLSRYPSLSKSWLKPYLWSYLFSYAYEAEAFSSSLIFQTLIQEGASQSWGQLTRETYELHAGYRHHWGRINLEVALIENIIWHLNTPDWGFQLGISYQ